MSANLFMIYQINDLEKSRDYRCRPYEYQIENSFMHFLISSTILTVIFPPLCK